ncbi:hypothetical protein CsSME_00037202 [Camellia sinensis var. sinensis]
MLLSQLPKVHLVFYIQLGIYNIFGIVLYFPESV